MAANQRFSRCKGLYVITDCNRLDSQMMLDRTEKILETGISVLQYRDKTDDQARHFDMALTLREMCDRTATMFVINDDIRLAYDTGADGVHLGKDDSPFDEARSLLGVNAIIGISCYNDIQAARRAQTQGADYIAFGAFYQTRTKTGTVEASPSLLTKAKAELSIPVVAIGGITPDNGYALIEAGADMLAVISSVYDTDDPGQVVSTFNALFQ